MEQCQASAFVVDCYGWGLVVDTEGEEHACLLLEYSELGSVYSELGKVWGVGMKPSEAWVYMRDAANGLRALHTSAKAMHRDLKASNMLLFENARFGKHAKLSDFGIAKVLEDLDAQVDTQEYSAPQRAPECRPGVYQYASIDTFHLGCLLLELRAGLPPFWYIGRDPALTPEQKHQRRCAAELKDPNCPYRSILTPVELQLGAACLAYDAAERPTVGRLVCPAHPYFRNGA